MDVAGCPEWPYLGDLRSRHLLYNYSLSGWNLSHIIMSITVWTAKGLTNYVNYFAKDNLCRFRIPKPVATLSQLPQAVYFFSWKTHPWSFGACVLWMLSVVVVCCQFVVDVCRFQGPSSPLRLSQLPSTLFFMKQTHSHMFEACILWIS